MNRVEIHKKPLVRAILVVAVVGAACLTRPVTTAPPNLNTTFTSTLQNQAVDKVDLLFMIDNSASMGDKQALLAAAVPDMIARLITPNCVDPTGTILGTSDQNGNCASGKPEFPPVHDMHIGIVSSSLGARGGNVCDPSLINSINGQNAHQDDRGELIARGGANETAVKNAGSLNFLAWFPPVQENQGLSPPPVPAEVTAGNASTPGTLIGDFASMIQGVNEHGCGYEGQNEAWYRFLVQPDPFAGLAINNNQATVTGVDATILQQRAAFLRPDSLLAVIVVTDENEQISNPFAVSKQAWLFETWPFFHSTMGQGAPEGTLACGAVSNSPGPNPGANDPACTSCALQSVTASTFAQQCPADPPNGAGGFLDQGDDGILLRFFDEKQRFGVAARYPVSRYVTGLTSANVPSQDHETDGAGNYVGDQAKYQNCVNPIYAQNLPTGITDPADPKLCNLTRGPRTPNQVFYAAIAGVPHQLLQSTPGDGECPAGTAAADCPQKAQLASADWTKIIGNDPVHYDFSGMDFHMLESAVPRAGSACPPTQTDTCDAINGREWDSKKQDLQYACIFPLVDPQTGALQAKDCTQPQFAGACDCQAGAYDNGAPLCAKDATGAYTQTQIAGKAYPSAREMEIAHAMATQTIGVQGIVSSLCPIHASLVGGTTDPLFGYRPAVNAIVDRLKAVLSVQCLPQKLIVQDDGSVPCLLLATLAKPGDESVCKNPGAGLAIPPSDILQRFQDTQYAAYLAKGGPSPGLTDPRTLPVCELTQIPNDPNDAGSVANYQACVSGSMGASGWCYVEGASAGSCPQQILFTQEQPPHGATVSLQCTEKVNRVVALEGGS